MGGCHAKNIQTNNNKKLSIASHRAQTLTHDLQNMKQQCYLLCGDKE